MCIYYQVVCTPIYVYILSSSIALLRLTDRVYWWDHINESIAGLLLFDCC